MNKLNLLTFVATAAVLLALNGCRDRDRATVITITLQPGATVPPVGPPDTLHFVLPSGQKGPFWVRFLGRNPCSQIGALIGNADTNTPATCNVVTNPAGDTEYVYIYGSGFPINVPDNIIICRGCR